MSTTTATASSGGSQSLTSTLFGNALGADMDSMVIGMQTSRPDLTKSPSASSVTPVSLREVVTPVSYWDSFRTIDASNQSWGAPLTSTSDGDSTMDIGLYKPRSH
mmetsp:Transcript_14376/g.29783  ORF Transcript_14376/g.29783 Transcript_14376/m.29783 type:complete len:105 (-) Transcript_14376:215-529(-)|eukprot:CAMPEP_0172444416 /NCGR_PEP_ID=MMETSP1065-20121228/4468_1 /TAXON_ID=265537 /ORGANISM="Amphiprora paludosa, Strain CCMP125" /LENGTH=104 /DNA_ID=CAMNT_0013194945 /DNA_START=158 /DNA_END=472 /DNA_ORIENTATION=-